MADHDRRNGHEDRESARERDQVVSDEATKPVKVSALARGLPRNAWKTIRWREGSKGDLVSRFTALRVRPSHRDYWRAEPWPQEWLQIEWPADKDEPLIYWLSTMPHRHAPSVLHAWDQVLLASPLSQVT